MLGHQDVKRVGAGGAEGSSDPGGVQAERAPDLDNKREPGQCQGQRQPDPPAHRLMQDVTGPERDEHGRDVLDQEGDSDLESVDGEEVEPLHEGQPADAEDDEVRELTATDAERFGAGGRERKCEQHEGAGRPNLGQP